MFTWYYHYFKIIDRYIDYSICVHEYRARFDEHICTVIFRIYDISTVLNQWFKNLKNIF